MSNSPTTGRGSRTSYLDRTWLNHWTVLLLTPIAAPDIADLRAKMVDFMASDPSHPLCCTLENAGTRWRPVAAADRVRHVRETIVPGGPFYLDDPYTYLDEHRPSPDSTAPFKVMVGADSMTFYFAHACGDAAVFSPFAVLMSLGDVEGLRSLRADGGLAVATKILLKEAPKHGGEWWSHLRSTASTPVPATTVSPPARVYPPTTTAAGTLLKAAEFNEFKAWRKAACPDLPTTALMASAAYLALSAEGVPLNDKGFFTLVDLRRHLPKKQSLRPGNFAKSAYIPADMADPAAVGAGLKHLVATARAVPALFSGALGTALRRSASPGSATQEALTMTFNSMMRNPGVEHIPWADPAEAMYITMAYPVGSDGISVSACAVEGRVSFSASFDPNRVDGHAVMRGLERLHDIPALLQSQAPDAAGEPLPSAAVELISTPTVGNAAR
ncbi:hypothetical protein MMAD_28240 [Mycolicibacterium madagascariense]|uniref:Acyltransferase n=1 Tax=Mycolicibacterium madagascariense TaxID=212765 RepID=A0A7I7XH62_9MYCO|nr:hypothetical protein [Mycolicibacterium madagascariense]MCV7014378.1 hypothetical protein [Mycolicibacterium madagascariense]BBZ28529.1 hypothetical protein MMAD_28240 [Mycolicibacterium madagascariense]